MAFADQPTADQLFGKVDEIRKAHPDNRCTKYLTREYYDSLDDEKKAVLWRCVKTGLDNPDSGLGCYAMKPSDYETFAPFFDKVRSRWWRSK